MSKLFAKIFGGDRGGSRSAARKVDVSPKRERRIEGKNIVIVGADTQVGEKLIKLLTMGENRFVLGVIESEKTNALETLCKEKQCQVVTVVFDPSSPEESAKKLMQQAINEQNGIDIFYYLLDCQHQGKVESFAQNTSVTNSLKRIYDTNFYCVVMCLKYSLPFLQKQRASSFVLLSNIAGETPRENFALYCSSKSALHRMFNKLEQEEKQTSVKLCVGPPAPSESINEIGKIEKVNIEDSVAQTIASKLQEVPFGRQTIIFLDPADKLTQNFLSASNGTKWS